MFLPWVICLLLSTYISVCEGRYTIYTMAGIAGSSGTTGDGNSSTAAKLHLPDGIVGDTNGNIYITNYGSHTIRKITRSSLTATSGTIYLVAGTPATSGSTGDGGDPTSAKLKNPFGIVIATNGDLYWTEASNYCVRKITASTGKISTYAGTIGSIALTAATSNALASTVKLGILYGLGIDTLANIYMFDYTFALLYKINMNGTTNTKLAGTGIRTLSGDRYPATNTNINTIYQLWIDDVGNVYYGDANNCVVRRYHALSSIIHTIIGKGCIGNNNSPATALHEGMGTSVGVSANVLGISGDFGGIYFADSTFGEIRYYQPTTNTNTSAGSYDQTGVVSIVAGKYTGSMAIPSNGDNATEYKLYYTANIYRQARTGEMYLGGGNQHVVRVLHNTNYNNGIPTLLPTALPSVVPSTLPSSSPTGHPTDQPSGHPSGQPSGHPTGQPSGHPSGHPTGHPSPLPSALPSVYPSSLPTTLPSTLPSSLPSPLPSTAPSTVHPTSYPTALPTNLPTRSPTITPTRLPTPRPTTRCPSATTTRPPTLAPTDRPSVRPSTTPTTWPSTRPPTDHPTVLPTSYPPSTSPSEAPSVLPTHFPTLLPTRNPSATHPTALPTGNPTYQRNDVVIQCVFTLQNMKNETLSDTGQRLFRTTIAMLTWTTVEENEMVKIEHVQERSSIYIAMGYTLFVTTLSTFSAGSITASSVERSAVSRGYKDFSTMLTNGIHTGNFTMTLQRLAVITMTAYQQQHNVSEEFAAMRIDSVVFTLLQGKNDTVPYHGNSGGEGGGVDKVSPVMMVLVGGVIIAVVFVGIMVLFGCYYVVRRRQLRSIRVYAAAGGPEHEAGEGCHEKKEMMTTTCRPLMTIEEGGHHFDHHHQHYH